ncbi:hypothetical protein CAPTEDRAFT_182619 [Capitella teleta]|uniref:PID domain-containing protein n=1 Tax=Capitella teleta TaxID=283909 RepID=R7UMH1_CAPTE|nr:hypothetical protein CAPTEDRAFT_182619 [Capitella teleta]|eukprot:ELU05117.1 hypothetical protein CAPTEDRAFT_182619 [Capitella teleta]
MGSTILEEQDLLEIGILDAAHRTLLIESCRALPQLKPIEEVTAQSVQQWLQSLNLTVYWDRFKSHNFTEMSRIQKMWDLELNNVLDIRPLGHRKRMLASLRQLSSEGESSGEEFKDFTRTLVRKNVDLRPPQVSTETNIQEWRHQPEVLIRGTCRYSAQYLGSTLVKDLQGTESTKEAIVKMKRVCQGSTESLCKVPTIILCISYKGVKFIDAKDKHVICEHEINNIFCACQDGENLNFFAYITKDHAQHYCHVFSVRNTELATEIILTLGEAFEVAYQVAVRAASQTPSTPALDGLHEETQPDVTSAEVPATSSSE